MASEPLFNPGFEPYVAPVEETPIETATEVTDVVTPAEVPTETPAAATETTPPAAETPTPTEVIKEVEKIVEKYPEMDEYTRELFDALMEGKEDTLLSYLTEKHKDYTKMSDYDVVKAQMRKEKPHYSDEDADLKIEGKYGELIRIDLSKIDETKDPDEYIDAVAHNKLVDRNQRSLKLDAIDARAELIAAKKEIKLPKIDTPKAQVADAPSAESIEQGRRDWQANVAKEIPQMQDFTYKVGDEDVSYKVSDAERKAEVAFFNDLDFNKLVGRLGWVDKDGKQNIQKMAGDVLKLEKMQTLISNAFTQGKTTGTKATVADIKNLDLSRSKATSVADEPFDIGKHGFGHLNPK